MTVLDILTFYESIKIDGLVKSLKTPFSVIPRTLQRDLRQAKAGIQSFQAVTDRLDPGFRRGDDFLRDHQNLWAEGSHPTTQVALGLTYS